MNTFVVSLFGHREINNLRESGNRLYEIIKELAKSKPYISFLIGRNGGAYTAMKYAEKLNKSIINLYKSEATY